MSVKRPTKIIVGAADTVQDGWHSLRHGELDITDARQWRRLFAPSSLNAILAEHVWEHLTIKEGIAAAHNCYEYLKAGGHVRVAVPDGYHPDALYKEWVRPNGSGERFLQLFRSDEHTGHKVLFNYQLLSKILSDVGFRVQLIEGFDATGRFHRNALDERHGKIHRCSGSSWSSVLSVIVGAPYTSLIVDAVK